MASAEPTATLEEYLALEAVAEVKHEYVGGHVVAMAGASPRHNMIASNILRRLSEGLDDGPCRVFASDQRVRVSETGAYVYPDLSIVCDDPRLTEEQPRSLENPQVIVEVLSRTTVEHDRGAKLAHYRRLASVTDIVLVEPNERRVEHYRRTSTSTWALHDIAEAAVELTSLGVALQLDDIYAKTDGLPLDAG